MSSESLPPWDEVLSAAARLQTLVPETVLVGGTAAAIMEAAVESLRSFDRLYPQPEGASALQQLAIQLADPRPYDLDVTRLDGYKNLASRWHDWNAVSAVAADIAVAILDRILEPNAEPDPPRI